LLTNLDKHQVMSTIITETAKTTGYNGIFPSNEVMLDLKDLKKVYPTPKGDYVVLEHLNLQIRKEEFVTIIGHSGCGKTTMLSMIAGLNPISGGNISVLGKHIKGPGPDRGVIFQAPSLMPWMTALQNVMLGVNQVFPHATKGQRNDIAKYYLQKVGLEDAFNKRASDLSQGMQQRVGIARAFAIKPKVLLLDEPSGC
jgi:nitrate/nitrite transport system ATP-binding protein